MTKLSRETESHPQGSRRRRDLYNTDRKTQVALKPTVSFLQDLNVLMSATGLDASEIIRESVHRQAEAVRTRWQARLDQEEQSETEV